MNDARSPAEVFLALVNGLCEGRLDEVVDLYAETTDVSHPFDPLRGRGFASREELRRHFSGRPLRQTFKAPTQNIRIHETRDPEVIIAEFEYAIDNIETNASSSYPCIFVMRVRDGKIVSSRDYVDHLGSAEARGRLGDLLSEIGTRRLPMGTKASS